MLSIPALLFLLVTHAQDTLPRFTAKYINDNRIIIEWINRLENVKQISIQRSTDSLRNFKTILTVPDPSNPQNGYADTRMSAARVFYRLYIMMDKGMFLFSNTKSPVWDTSKHEISSKRLTSAPEKLALNLPVIPGDTIARGSLAANKPKVEAWAPSKFVYTYRDGYIRISLPAEAEKKYSLKFFTADNQPLFEIHEVKQRNFKLDKTNFYRSGWFLFELYEDGKLKEKNKFFLPKEF